MSTNQWLFLFAAFDALGVLFAFFRIDVRILRGLHMNRALAVADEATRREKIMAVFALLSLVFSGFGYFYHRASSADQESKQVLVSWGIDPAQAILLKLVAAKVDGRAIVHLKEQYKVAAVAFHYDGMRDILDSGGLQKSALYDIKDAEIEIRIPIDNEFVNDVSSGKRGTNYVLLLVPNGTSMNQFTTLREAKSLGILQRAGGGGPP